MLPSRIIINTLFFVSVCTSAKAQSTDQGNGIVTVVIFNRSKVDTVQNNNVIKSYRYFVKGNKVLRKDSVSNQDKLSSAKDDTLKSRNRPNVTIKTSFTTTIVHPIYLIDLEKHQALTFFKQDSQLFVSVDTLDKHFEEVLYKPKNKKKGISFHYMPDILPQVIAGKTCYAAQWISKEDSNYFRYTKEPMKVKSPLNVLVPDFPYPILSVDAKSTKRTGEFEANVTFIITELQEVNLPDNLFAIPHDAILKYNVPLSDMARGVANYSKDN